MRFRAKAPAKLNLYLHVVGRRADGYHLLDSLFAFTDYGDEVEAFPANGLSLKIVGPYAAKLSACGDNIVLKAAEKLAEALGVKPAAEIVLEKNLPLASGIGGGSSDAAATLAVLQRLWGKSLPADELGELALSLGADVPSCLKARPVHVSGIGERLEAVPDVPHTAVLLANPDKPVATPSVFKNRTGGFSRPDPLTPDEFSPDNFIRALKRRRNDLTEGAVRVEPEIQNVLKALDSCDSCLFSRMSGSGGTCFAFFDDADAARKARRDLEAEYPFWWFRDTFLL